MSYRAVIFDLGGVVLDSPLHAIARYERDLEIPEGHINRVVVDTGPSGAWSRLERGELAMEAFFHEFDRECGAAGHAISAAEMMARIAAASAPRPAMLNAIRRLRTHDYRVAALTNNWAHESDDATPRHADLRDLFHVFVESSVVGLRKPDPRIYEHTCDALGVGPDEAVFLDDIGSNLKSARALGMHTIKVVSAEQALGELASAIDLDLSSE
jgi:putative hydrolase of the HAD superfamily